MDVEVEVDADYAFGREVFGSSSPIPRLGASVTPCEGATLTLREIIERRGEGALITFALLLGIAANISNLARISQMTSTFLNNRHGVHPVDYGESAPRSTE